MEFDLRNDRRNLTDFWAGRMSFRELWLVIRFLPAGSEFKKALAPRAAEMASWGPAEYLLKALYDATVYAHFKDPEPYPAPEQQIREREREGTRVQRLEAQAQRIRDQEARG